jgi:hypothetical protein
MSKPTLYGPAFSTYVRSVRLALEEKGVDYNLVEIDFLQGLMPTEQIERHPFVRVPAFEHDGFKLYETTAICRYPPILFLDFQEVNLVGLPNHYRRAILQTTWDGNLRNNNLQGLFPYHKHKVPECRHVEVEDLQLSKPGSWLSADLIYLQNINLSVVRLFI